MPIRDNFVWTDFVRTNVDLMLIIYLDSNVWFEIPLYITVLVRKIERLRQAKQINREIEWYENRMTPRKNNRKIWKQNDTKTDQ